MESFYFGWDFYKEEMDFIFHKQKSISDNDFSILHERIEDMSEYFMYTPGFEDIKGGRIKAADHLCQLLSKAINAPDDRIPGPVLNDVGDDDVNSFAKNWAKSVLTVRSKKATAYHYFS